MFRITLPLKYSTEARIIAVVLLIKLLIFTWAVFSFNFASNPNEDWISIWDRWDSGSYKAIATSAYLLTNTKLEDWAFHSHFPPLYPALIYLVSLFGFTIPFSGVLVSFISNILASLMLYKLAFYEFKDKQIAFSSVLFLNLYPTSYFAVSVYSESLFLFLTISSFYYLRKENYFTAGLFAFGSILTRIVGVVLVPIYFLYFIYNYYQNRKFNFQLFYLCLLPILAVVIYMGINKFYYDDYLFFLNEKISFNTTKHLIVPFKESYDDLIATFKFNNYKNQEFMMTRGWNAIFTFSTLLIIILGIKRMRWEYALFSIASLFLFASLSWGISNARYAFAIFPIFMILGSFKNKLLQGGVMGIFLVMLLYFTVIFTSGSWAF
ncbi:MAG: glycosyltransferase family 39 protein [bacterium]|nr:glycosyltransferase family 39 protein [bacterium]